jgi:uncharacterized protein (TIGR03435 family)
MMRLTVFAAFACALAAQTPDSQVVFEVASIKPSPPPDPRGMTVGSTGGPGTKDPTRFTAHNYDMTGLLATAYGVQRYQLSGPGWLDSERYEITAKVPEGTTKAQFMLMVRNLLIERFKLSVHMEKKELAGYQLVVAKGGPKVTKSPGAPGEPDAGSTPDGPVRMKFDKEGYPVLAPGRQASMSGGYGRSRWRLIDESMEDFAEGLSGQVDGKPVVDATGLTGKYDFEIFWSYATMQSDASIDSGPSIFAAVQQQLGLRLESKRVPVDIVVIDHLERVPTEN